MRKTVKRKKNWCVRKRMTLKAVERKDCKPSLKSLVRTWMKGTVGQKENGIK